MPPPDVIRQAQQLRKEVNLAREGRPAPDLHTDAPQLRQAIEAHRDCIAGKTLTGRRAPSSTKC